MSEVQQCSNVIVADCSAQVTALLHELSFVHLLKGRHERLKGTAEMPRISSTFLYVA